MDSIFSLAMALLAGFNASFVIKNPHGNWTWLNMAAAMYCFIAAAVLYHKANK